MADVRAKLEADQAKIERAIMVRLNVLGLECVSMARQLDTYQDQTGNLRNSVGYIITRNGVVVKDNFKKTALTITANKKGVEGFSKGSGDGVTIGRDLAVEKAAKYPKGFALIVVAGMNYADAVELKGYDVLSSAEQYAKKELPRMAAKLKIDVKSMK